MAQIHRPSNDQGKKAKNMRAPDLIIGGAENPYIYRWWVIPRNRLFNIYLHHIVRDDDDRALHDHPWVNISVVLKGGYTEVMPHATKWRTAGSLVFRRPTSAHRLIVGKGSCWSLFITGPRVREWGFLCPKGWRSWRIFTAADDSGRIGRGCDD